MSFPASPKSDTGYVLVDDDGNVVRNYRPGWVAGMTQQTVPGVSESVFKFYRQVGTGHVR